MYRSFEYRGVSSGLGARLKAWLTFILDHFNDSLKKCELSHSRPEENSYKTKFASMKQTYVW